MKMALPALRFLRFKEWRCIITCESGEPVSGVTDDIFRHPEGSTAKLSRPET